MTEPSSPFARPMAWWGAIQSSVRSRATTAEVWSAIRDFGAREGLTYPPGMFGAVNEMRSLARGLRVGAERLARAAPSDAITAGMLGSLPYGRGAAAQAVVRKFHVRVGYTALRAGEAEPGYVTLEYTGGLTATVGELYADAEAMAENLVLGTAPRSGGADAFLGIESIEIGEY